MNKELIKKYKKEFDHWLNGGSVLIKSSLGWCSIVTEFTWGCNISVDELFVINDEYSAFRKALAEGKTIEYLDKSSNIWQESKDINFSLHPTCYRIKPEPEFKVGDYIRRSGYDTNVGKIREIYKDKNEKITGFFTDIYFFSIGECKLWKPLKNEYCWFRDDIDDTPIFSKFMHMTRDEVNEEIMWYYAENGDEFNKKYYKICQPFLGRLPEGCK